MYVDVEAVGCSEHYVAVLSDRIQQNPPQAMRKPPKTSGQSMLHSIAHVCLLITGFWTISIIFPLTYVFTYQIDTQLVYNNVNAFNPSAIFLHCLVRTVY